MLTLAVALWIAACVCLGVVLLGDGGPGFLAGYAVLQGGAIVAGARARRDARPR